MLAKLLFPLVILVATLVWAAQAWVGGLNIMDQLRNLGKDNSIILVAFHASLIAGMVFYFEIGQCEADDEILNSRPNKNDRLGLSPSDLSTAVIQSEIKKSKFTINFKKSEEGDEHGKKILAPPSP